MEKSSNINLGKIIVMTIMALIILVDCKTSSYITDQDSRQRQKMIRRYRTGINFSDVFVQLGSAVTTATTGLSLYSATESKSFKRLKLKNECQDTLFVNMITDCLWRDSSYCDIREIVIPPLKTVKLVAPLGATYNVYFRKDFDAPDDEKIEINTASDRIVRLGTKIINTIN